MRSSATTQPRTTSLLVSERNRWWVAIAACVLVMFPALSAFDALGFEGVHRYAAGYVVSYGLMLAVYAAITLLAFSRHFGACARDASASGRPRTAGGSEHRDTLTASLVVFSALALGAAVWFATFAPSARTPVQAGVAATATVGIVVAAWATVATAYAADYARRATARGGLDFPGAGDLGFGDYLYFAVAVSTTFGTTDVTVLSREMRRLVLGHSLVAFSFNTVILALLVSALLT